MMHVLVHGLLGIGLITSMATVQQHLMLGATVSEKVAITRIGNSHLKAEAKGSIVINQTSSPRGKSASRVSL